MNACRDQGRKAGTIDCEDAQKNSLQSAGKYLYDNSKTNPHN